MLQIMFRRDERRIDSHVLLFKLTNVKRILGFRWHFSNVGNDDTHADSPIVEKIRLYSKVEATYESIQRKINRSNLFSVDELIDIFVACMI